MKDVSSNRRALPGVGRRGLWLYVIWVGVCECAEFRQVFPKEFATIDDFSAAHVEEIDGEHGVFVVVSENVGGLGHALLQGADEIGALSFEKQLHVADRFGVDLRSCKVLDAGPEASLDVVLQAGPGMIAREIDLARRHQKVPVDEVD